MKNLFLDKNTNVAVIGFGRFGKLMVKILLKYSQVKITLIESKKINISHKNLIVGSYNAVKNADVIIPCVPISNFETLVKQIAPLVKKNAIIMDVCSVKILPVDIMRNHLPTSTQIIASHPMFGPDSYRIKKRLNGLKLVIWNISTKKDYYLQVKKFFSNLGLTIIEITPKDHDKYMAFSLGYSYFIGKIGQRMDIKKTPIDTYDFKLLLDHISIIRKDSEQLFFDMQTKNPYAKKMLTKLNRIYDVLLKEIKSKK
ncbi:prephenate dehydrogenase [Candidatus Daviesbacteria bacterium]|nr:prephenate dehydrogenase [Candidatus Daviesbacteria bacterium]